MWLQIHATVRITDRRGHVFETITDKAMEQCHERHRNECTAAKNHHPNRDAASTDGDTAF